MGGRPNEGAGNEWNGHTTDSAWRYSTMSFFAPMTPYASEGAGPAAAAREFKTMVKTLHAHGIEAGWCHAELVFDP